MNTDHDERYRDYWQTYHRLMARRGVTQQFAKIEMRRRLTLIGSMLLHKGEVHGMLCGTWGTPAMHLKHIDQVIGLRPGAKTYACMNGLIMPGRQVMMVDTHINVDPSAEQLAEITVMAAEGASLEPKLEWLSSAALGTSPRRFISSAAITVISASCSALGS